MLLPYTRLIGYNAHYIVTLTGADLNLHICLFSLASGVQIRYAVAADQIDNLSS